MDTEDIKDAESLDAPPSQNLLGTVESAITSLPDDAPTDAILQLHTELGFYQREATRLLKLVEARMIQRIGESGPINFGNGITYYLSHPKTTKCNDLQATIAALGEATGGEEKAFLGCFSVNAIKHGAAKKILPVEVYAKLFTVTVKDKLETGEAAPKQLTRADAKFR